MSRLTTLEELLAQEIKDFYSAETQLVEALPKMAAAASSSDLIEAFEKYREETEKHLARLREIAGLLGITPHGKNCRDSLKRAGRSSSRTGKALSRTSL
jgi:ferritin-like metal-binding protein YciE